MTKYVLWGSYCPDVLEHRAPHRQAHLDRLSLLKRSGQLITIGPTQDLSKVFGIYEAPSIEVARLLVEEDPYWINKVWTEYTLQEWIQAF